MSRPKVPRQLAAARRHLSDAQLIDFLRAASGKGTDRTLRSLLEAIDGGEPLEVMMRSEEITIGDEVLGSKEVHLRVKPLGERTYLVEIGLYILGGGGGSEWEVEYGPQGDLLRVEGTVRCIT